MSPAPRDFEPASDTWRSTAGHASAHSQAHAADTRLATNGCAPAVLFRDPALGRSSTGFLHHAAGSQSQPQPQPLGPHGGSPYLLAQPPATQPAAAQPPAAQPLVGPHEGSPYLLAQPPKRQLSAVQLLDAQPLVVQPLDAQPPANLPLPPPSTIPSRRSLQSSLDWQPLAAQPPAVQPPAAQPLVGLHGGSRYLLAQPPAAQPPAAQPLDVQLLGAQPPAAQPPANLPLPPSTTIPARRSLQSSWETLPGASTSLHGSGSFVPLPPQVPALSFPPRPAEVADSRDLKKVPHSGLCSASLSTASSAGPRPGRSPSPDKRRWLPVEVPVEARSLINDETFRAQMRPSLS